MSDYKKQYPDTERVKPLKDKILNDAYWTGNDKIDNEMTLNNLIHAAIMDFIDSNQMAFSAKCIEQIKGK
jgi:hypothetical protein